MGHAAKRVHVEPAGQLVDVGVLVAMRNGAYAGAHFRINFCGDNNLARIVPHAHLAAICDAMFGGGIGMDQAVANLAQKADLAVELATLPARGIDRRFGLAEIGLVFPFPMRRGK